MDFIGFRVGFNNIEQVLQSARAHGDASEPDHEIGDLQDALRLVFDRLSRTQRRLVLSRMEREIEDWRNEG